MSDGDAVRDLYRRVLKLLTGIWVSGVAMTVAAVAAIVYFTPETAAQAVVSATVLMAAAAAVSYTGLRLGEDWVIEYIETDAGHSSTEDTA